MEAVIVVTIITSTVALLSSVIANMRFHSRCRAGDNLEVSIQKKYNEDLATDEQINKKMKQLQDLFTSSDYDSSD
jgi:hypothetical protein